MTWIRSRRLHLDGTTLALDPEYGSSYWFVVDVERPTKALSCALPLASAKKHAERLAAKIKGRS